MIFKLPICIPRIALRAFFPLAFTLFYNATIFGQDLKSYYYEINLAELQIVLGNYKEANEHYLMAFKYNPENEKDLYNSFLISYFIKDTALATVRLQKLAYFGLPKEYIECKLQTREYFITLCKMANFDSCRNEGWKAADKKLLQELEQLIILDQSRGAEAIHLKTESERKRILSQIDKKTMDTMLKIIKKYGWPSFHQIGYWLNNANPLSNNSAFELTMWHNRFRTNIMDYFAINAIKAGNFRPDIWAKHILSRNMLGIKKFNDYGYHVTVWDIKDIPHQKLKKYDAARKEIFLESLTDYFQKFQYQSTNNLEFGGDSIKSIFGFVHPILIPRPGQEALYN
jgi:tetratricopeptide (TPR) repeat protein